MKTIKKTVSVLLAVMMLFSMLTVASISVSAAGTTGTVTVTSNLCDATEVTYDENDTQVEVTYYLQSDNMILNAQGAMTYDSTVLKLADTNTSATCMPILGAGSSVVNLKLDNKVKFNSTSLDLYDFTSKGVFFTATFDIVGSGDTTVDLDVEVITATTAKTYDDILAGAEDIDIVYFGEYMTDAFTFTSEAEVIGTEVGDSEISIYGDINLDLAASDASNVYVGTVELEAGTYTFNVNDDGTVLGFNYTYTDTATIDYSAGYKAATTLVATGGRYTFTYNNSTKVLKISFKSFADIVELFGDINVELVRTSSTSTVFTGSARVAAGTYTFRINDQGTQKCFGYEFDDVVYGAQYNKDWTAATTFIASGGIYSVKYDTATSALTFMHAPAGLGDVRIFGDLNVDLAKQGNTLYSAQTVLEAGSYQFRVDALGTTLCNGSTFTDTMNNIPYQSSWKAASTFTATQKLKYTFIFDTSTNTLKVFNAPIDTTKVLVAFEDSNLELTSADGVTYTATTTLAAGTYSFRIDEFGTTMCFGGTFTNSINGITYSSAYKSATTFNATGGDYTFSYNVNTDKLTVVKA